MSSFVYWIKHKDHTDIFKEGYVGITSRTVKVRYQQHKSTANKLRNNGNFKQSEVGVVHRAIIKYGKDIEVITLCECDLEYSYWLENNLRPAPNIGWNISAGGGSVGRLGRKQTDKQKLASSKTWKGKHLDNSYLVEILKVRVMSEEEITKRSKLALETHLLDMANVNKDVLSLVNDIYKLYLKGYRAWRISKALNLKLSTGYKSFFRRFSEGYDPLSDKRLQDFVSEYSDRFGTYNQTSPCQYTEKDLPKNIHRNKRGHLVAYRTVDYKRSCKSFNVHILGEDEALRQALDWLEYSDNKA